MIQSSLSAHWPQLLLLMLLLLQLRGVDMIISPHILSWSRLFPLLWLLRWGCVCFLWRFLGDGRVLELCFDLLDDLTRPFPTGSKRIARSLQEPGSGELSDVSLKEIDRVLRLKCMGITIVPSARPRCCFTCSPTQLPWWTETPEMSSEDSVEAWPHVLGKENVLLGESFCIRSRDGV